MPELKMEPDDAGTCFAGDIILRTPAPPPDQLAKDLSAAGCSWMVDHHVWRVPKLAHEQVAAVIDYWNALICRGLRWDRTATLWRLPQSGSEIARLAVECFNATAPRVTKPEGEFQPDTAAPEPQTAPPKPDGPQTLEEYDVGQGRVIRAMRVALDAAKQRGEPLDHVLLDGPPGLGKTTLANIIAKELGVPILRTSGPALEKREAADLVPILSGLQEGQVLFIDEIHACSRLTEEALYPAIESFQLQFVRGVGDEARAEAVPLPRFTLIGATARPGLVSAPLRSRFGIHQHLDFYRPEQLKRIATAYADSLGVGYTDNGLMQIARRSRGTARTAKLLLRRVRDYAQVEGDGRINQEAADRALTELGIDGAGLDPQDRKYLRTLITVHKGGPAGVRAIASTLNLEQDTLEDVVEPFLLKSGFIVRKPRGREVTDLARQHLGMEEAPRWELTLPRPA